MTRLVQAAPDLARHNRKDLARHARCGCYFCLKSFASAEITDFSEHGKTGLCPHCGTDALLPGITEISVLSAACERWFTAPATDAVAPAPNLEIEPVTTESC